MNLNRIVHGIGANVYDKIVISGVQLALVPVLVNCWGLETYGAWLLLATIPSFLSMSDLGFATAAGTSMTMAAARGERDKAARTFQSAWLMVVGCTATMLVVAVAGAWLMPDWSLPSSPSFTIHQSRIALTFLAAYGIISLQASIMVGGFRSAGYYPLAVFWNSNVILVENLCAIAVATLGGAPILAAQTLLVCRIIALAGQAFLLRVKVPWLSFGFRQASWGEVRSLAKPALGVMALPFSQATFLQGTAIALGAAAGEAAVPAFTAVRTISRIGLQTTQLVVHAVMPEFSSAMAQGNRAALGAMILATLIFTGLIAVPFAVILAIFGTDIVALWTRGAIQPPEGLLLVMTFTVLLGGLWNPLSNLILAANRHGVYAIFFTIFSLLTVPFSYLLSVQLGATGAAASIAMMDAGMTAVVIWQAFKLFRHKVDIRGAVQMVSQRAYRVKK